MMLEGANMSTDRQNLAEPCQQTLAETNRESLGRLAGGL